MSATGLIYTVGLSIASMAFIFMFMLIRKVEITEEKILKILQEDVEKIKEVKSDDELKELIRSLPKKKKEKLKTLFESQDLYEAMNHIKKHILKVNPEEDLNANQD